MNDLRSRWSDALPGRRPLGALIAAAGFVLVAALAAHLLLGADVEQLVDDPLATTGGHPLTGILSHVGVLAWWTGAVACLFAALIMRHDGGQRETTRFLLWGGLITAYLALDDLFMFHEDLLRRHTPIPQPATIALVALVVAAYLWRFRRTVGAREWPLLAIAIASFTTSLGIDFLSDLGKYFEAWETPGIVTFLEDWLKLSGIFAWMTYFVRSAAAGVHATRVSRG